MQLTSKNITRIHEKALDYYQELPIDPRNPDSHAAVCYIQATLDFLIRNGYSELSEIEIPMEIPYDTLD